MITADVLSELFVEEAIGATTAGETSEGQPLRWFVVGRTQPWVSV